MKKLGIAAVVLLGLSSTASAQLIDPVRLAQLDEALMLMETNVSLLLEADAAQISGWTNAWSEQLFPQDEAFIHWRLGNFGEHFAAAVDERNAARTAMDWAWTCYWMGWPYDMPQLEDKVKAACTKFGFAENELWDIFTFDVSPLEMVEPMEIDGKTANDYWAMAHALIYPGSAQAAEAQELFWSP